MAYPRPRNGRVLYVLGPRLPSAFSIRESLNLEISVSLRSLTRLSRLIAPPSPDREDTFPWTCSPAAWVTASQDHDRTNHVRHLSISKALASWADGVNHSNLPS